MLPTEPIQLKKFDINHPVEKYGTNLPHWRQDNVTYFISFRLKDSLPAEVVQEWQGERQAWCIENQIKFDSTKPIRSQDIPEPHRNQFEMHCNRKMDEYPDKGRGACTLNDQACRSIVVDSIDQSLCEAGDFIIMPNHVHLLLNESEQEELKTSMQKIKGGSSFKINRLLDQKGSLWNRDSFDHIVRSSDTLEAYQKYIAQNPVKAGLSPDQYTHHSATYKCI